MQYTNIIEINRALVLRLETNKLNMCSVARAINKNYLTWQQEKMTSVKTMW
jgi:hypothetical protein